MSNLLHEQISAFMDGELPAEECELLLRRLASNRELVRRWHAYHLIGDTLRGQVASHAARDIAPRVGEALAPHAARARVRRPHRFTTLAAGITLVGLAGVVGALVSQQFGGGRVFTSGPTAVVSHGVGTASAQQINWQQAPTPVRAELNRYLMRHDLYGPVSSALAEGATANAVVLTAASPLPVAGTGQDLNPPRQ
ncbi:MAG TPA: sigma-E factor negative regulatory protein [Gammaproteobacteria bacterium]|nr:sigma-E factor negative regulatory protein [Gammaproteobacteria bacterium]